MNSGSSNGKKVAEQLKNKGSLAIALCYAGGLKSDREKIEVPIRIVSSSCPLLTKKYGFSIRRCVIYFG
jgi:hypothetical protein